MNRRRFLKGVTYVAPAIIGSMIVSKTSFASSENSATTNPSCAPVFCAPCGRSGSKSEKECVKFKKENGEVKNGKI